MITLSKTIGDLKKSPRNGVGSSNERDRNNSLLDSFMLDEIQRRKKQSQTQNYLSNKRKQVLIEFNAEIEDQLINIICEKVLQHPETRATLCDLDFSKIYSLSTKPFNFRLVHKKLEEDNGMIHPPGKSPQKKRPVSHSPIRSKLGSTVSNIFTPTKKPKALKPSTDRFLSSSASYFHGVK